MAYASVLEAMDDLNHADQRKTLVKATTGQLHALGMVVRAIPSTVVRREISPRWDFTRNQWNAAIHAHPQGSAKRKRLTFARDAWEMLKEMVEHGICSAPPINGEFVRLVVGGGHRTDTEVLIGLHLARDNRPNIAVRRMVHRPSAVVAWGVCDEEDMDDANQPSRLLLRNRNEATGINHLVRTKRVAEIDLVCAAGQNAPHHFWGVQGAGRAMLAHLLALIISKKKAGAPRFQAVITYLAQAPGQPPPLLSAAVALGFTPIQSRWRNDATGQRTLTGRRYYVLEATQHRTLAQKVAAAVAATKMCPLKPRTGRTYCT